MKIRSEKGISGIDIIVAVILITIFVVMITMLSYQIRNNSEQIERKTQATHYAIEEIERIKSEGFEELPLLSEGKRVIKEEYIEGTSYYLTIYIWDYTELENNSDKTPDIVKKVDVEVSYQVNRQTEKVEISTVLSKEN